MKFSNSLKFNAVAEWWEDYIAYSALKKQIYIIEKENHRWRAAPDDPDSPEQATFLSRTENGGEAAFEHLLDRELKKITLFYHTQEKELLDQLAALEFLIAQKEEEGPNSGYDQDLDDDDDDDDDLDDSRMAESGVFKPTRKSSNGGVGRKSPTRSPSLGATSREQADLEASLDSLRAHQPTSAPSTERTRQRKTSIIRPISSIFHTFIPQGSLDSSELTGNIWTSKDGYSIDVQLLLKRRITSLFVQFTSLQSYVELNYSGFRKILKKFDKVTDGELKDRYMHDVVQQAYPFTHTAREQISSGVSKLVDLYTKCVTRDDRSQAERQLRVHQREQIAWERDTVWRQMISQARRGEQDGQLKALEHEASPAVGTNVLLSIETGVGAIKLKRKHISLALAVAVFAILLQASVLDTVEASNCFAILTFSTILWATEAIPLFVTSMMVPLLVVACRVIRRELNDGSFERLDTPDATKYIFSVMFSPTIMLLIGGFTIASALSKTNIDRLLITKVLSLAGTKPSIVLLSFMGVSCFASMWISNVAAPTLCFTLIRPILRTLPPKASFGPCIILAIALAANIGGQSSPISSPQNLIALQKMDPPLGWLQWFAVSIPVGIVSILLIWLLLLAAYKPGYTVDGEELLIKPIRSMKDPFTLKQYWVSFVCIATIALWCVEHSIEAYVGDMGVIAIIPLVAFFSTGVLKKEDFEQFLWTVVFLAMGGIALGKAVTSSGLLDVLDEGIRHLVNGLSLYTVVLVLSAVVLVVSTFISHTIASVLLVPIAAEVGKNLPQPHDRLLIFLTALICSAGMGMPVSGFPNQTAATQEDEMGQLYLSNIDFLRTGVPASIIATFVVATVGYVLMRAIGL